MLKFLKMHGCGNDFIVFDDPQAHYSWDDLAKLAQRNCTRRFSVGADGVIAVTKQAAAGESWPAGVHYEMRYVNADGSRAEMCGNGIRCLGKFVAEQLGDNRDEIRVLTGAGILPIMLKRDASGIVGSVTVDMGVPGLNAAEVPTTLRLSGEQVVSTVLEVGDERLALTAISMGNPHAVVFVDSLTDEQVEGLGPQIETHPVFPEKTNVEFVRVVSPTKLRMRVWERGVGETWACGTGACASVVAAVLNRHCPEAQEITVSLNGGELQIMWPGEGFPVQMTGPATTVYCGELEV